MTLFPELDNLDLAGLIESFTGDPLDGPEYGRTYYDEVAYQIGQQGDEGLNYLWDRQGQVDADRQGAILLALSTLELRLDRPVEELLRSNLDSEHPLVVADAIDGLQYRGIDTPEVRAQVLVHDDHPSKWVRAAVLRYLSRLFPDEARPILVEALQDLEPLIRENAIDELDDMGAVEFIPEIESLLNDLHPNVREAAAIALDNLRWLMEDEADESSGS